MVASRLLGNYRTKNLHQELLGVPPLDPKENKGPLIVWQTADLKSFKSQQK